MVTSLASVDQVYNLHQSLSLLQDRLKCQDVAAPHGSASYNQNALQEAALVICVHKYLPRVPYLSSLEWGRKWHKDIQAWPSSKHYVTQRPIFASCNWGLGDHNLAGQE
jgi:hypothetical protein